MEQDYDTEIFLKRRQNEAKIVGKRPKIEKYAIKMKIRTILIKVHDEKDRNLRA